MQMKLLEKRFDRLIRSTNKMSKTPFCATSEQDQKTMFDVLNINSFDELFASIPEYQELSHQYSVR